MSSSYSCIRACWFRFIHRILCFYLFSELGSICLLWLSFFMPPPTDRCVGGMFSGCPSVSASVRASIQACFLLAWYLTNQETKFHQTFVDNVVQGRGERIGFWRSRSHGQGRDSEVKYLSDFFVAGGGVHINAWASKFFVYFCVVIVGLVVSTSATDCLERLVSKMI